jgi:cytochrome c biogenesis protein CcmG, thiol:disulfide interchange protein DsbE
VRIRGYAFRSVASRGKLVLQVGAVAVVALLLGLLGWRLAANEDGQGLVAQIRSGEKPPAPEFELDRLDGDGALKLSSLRGQAVVLNFWASWCNPCRDEAPELQQAAETWADDGVVVLGLDFNDFSGDARRFADKYGLTYPIVTDPQGAVAGRFGVTGVPETFFIDKSGRIVSHVRSQIAADELEAGIKEALAS